MCCIDDERKKCSFVRDDTPRCKRTKQSGWHASIALVALWMNIVSNAALPLSNDATDTSYPSVKLRDRSSAPASVWIVMDKSNERLNRPLGEKNGNRITHEFPASPAELLKPDKFLFYAYNDQGKLVVKQMTLNEIQTLIAGGNGGHVAMEIYDAQKTDDSPTGEKKVLDVVEKVQNVLKSALNGSTTSTISASTIPQQVNVEWSNILPSILSGSEANEALATSEEPQSLTHMQPLNFSPVTESEIASLTEASSSSVPSDGTGIDQTPTTVAEELNEVYNTKTTEKEMILVPVITTNLESFTEQSTLMKNSPSLMSSVTPTSESIVTSDYFSAATSDQQSSSTAWSRVSPTQISASTVALKISTTNVEETSTITSTSSDLPDNFVSKNETAYVEGESSTTSSSEDVSTRSSTISMHEKSSVTTVSSTKTSLPISQSDEPQLLRCNASESTNCSTSLTNDSTSISTSISHTETATKTSILPNIVTTPLNANYQAPSITMDTTNETESEKNENTIITLLTEETNAPSSLPTNTTPSVEKTQQTEKGTSDLTEMKIDTPTTVVFVRIGNQSSESTTLSSTMQSTILETDIVTNENDDTTSSTVVESTLYTEDRYTDDMSVGATKMTANEVTTEHLLKVDEINESLVPVNVTETYNASTYGAHQYEESTPSTIESTVTISLYTDTTKENGSTQVLDTESTGNMIDMELGASTASITEAVTEMKDMKEEGVNFSTKMVTLLETTSKGSTSKSVTTEIMNENSKSTTVPMTKVEVSTSENLEVEMSTSEYSEITNKTVVSDVKANNATSILLRNEWSNDTDGLEANNITLEIKKKDNIDAVEPLTSTIAVTRDTSMEVSTRDTATSVESTSQSTISSNLSTDSAYSKKKIDNETVTQNIQEVDRWMLISHKTAATVNELSSATESIAQVLSNTTATNTTDELTLEMSQNANGLDVTVKKTESDVVSFSRMCNDMAFNLWTSINKGVSTGRSLVVSPFGMSSLLAMIFLGARGSTSDQMNEVLKLDDVATFNPHLVFQNVTDTVGLARGQGITNAAFVRELFVDRAKIRKTMPFYKDQAQQFYEGLVGEVNFATIGDIVRRRTNLLIRKQTGGRIKDFIKASTVPLRSPLAAVSANVFQTDCNSSAVSSDGRDGELYFAVSPAVRQRKLIPLAATVWRANVLAGYEPALDATAVALGKTENLVTTIFVLPGQQGHVAPGDTLERLERRLIGDSARQNAWERLLKVLIPRNSLEVQIPKFVHRSILNATAALKRMGFDKLFSDEADLKGINGIGNHLHMSDILQINMFGTCGDENSLSGRHHVETYPAIPFRRIRQDEETLDDATTVLQSQSSRDVHWKTRNAHTIRRTSKFVAQSEKPRLKLDRPFLYFVRHNPTGLILHMGRFSPKLLP